MKPTKDNVNLLIEQAKLQQGTTTIWTLDDDTSVHTIGRGSAYRYWTELS